MAREDDDQPRPSVRFERPVLDRFSVEELTAYITELRAEIKRVEADLIGKQSHRSAADAFFRPNKPGG